LRRCRTYLGIFAELGKLVLIAGFVSLLGPSLQAQDVTIRVLDGRNGHPVTKERLVVWVGPVRGTALELPTDKDGVAVLHLSKDHADSIELTADYNFDCQPYRKNTPTPSYSVKEILQSGVVTQNTCGKLSQSEAKPGELIFFVRPLHWWEGFRR